MIVPMMMMMMMMLMKMAVIIVPSFLFLRRVLRILNAPWLAPTLYLTISSTILYYTINHTILYHQPFYTINHTIPSTIPYHILNWVGLNNTELQRITVYFKCKTILHWLVLNSGTTSTLIIFDSRGLSAVDVERDDNNALMMIIFGNFRKLWNLKHRLVSLKSETWFTSSDAPRAEAVPTHADFISDKSSDCRTRHCIRPNLATFRSEASGRRNLRWGRIVRHSTNWHWEIFQKYLVTWPPLVPNQTWCLSTPFLVWRVAGNNCTR